MAKVLLFGPLRDLAGWRERTLDPAPATLFALRAALSDEDPALGAALIRPGVQAAVDKALVRGDVALAAGAEVAFLPPMSGEMIQLTGEAFDPGALLTGFSMDRRETGAIVSFTGLVRAEAGESRALELEAYAGFTELAIEAVAEAARERFRLHDLLIVHRIGRMEPGEAIVFVATAAGHRREAFEAADLLMDYLKSRAPFWKKSLGPDGERWIEPTPKDYEDAARWDERA